MSGYRIMGWVMTLLAVAVLFLDSRHCDLARLMMFCFIFMIGNAFWEKDDEEKRKAGRTREGKDGDNH